jgi:serine/threonine protein kinase
MSNQPSDPWKPGGRAAPPDSGRSIRAEDTPDTFAGRGTVQDPDLIPLNHVPQAAADGGPPVGPGESIPGYEIVSELGRGAMGVVYKARQVRLNRPVALKLTHAWATATAEEKARFQAEAMAVAKVQHPNVIQIFDIGEHAGLAYLAVEYVDGGTLADRIGKGRPLPIGTAVHLMQQIARGVGAAHSRGVIHRDLKPANILLTADGTPKVADFGLAKQLGADSHTVTGSILGTPAYMAPEQAMGQIRRIAPQTDVFSLGAILYETVTGEVPFKGNTVMETLDKVRTAEPLEMKFRRRDVPPQLEGIVRRCLSKQPSDRYPTADALADDLARVTAGPVPEKLPPLSINMYHVLTALAALAAVILAVWLFGFADFSRRPSEDPWPIKNDPTPKFKFSSP